MKTNEVETNDKITPPVDPIILSDGPTPSEMSKVEKTINNILVTAAYIDVAFPASSKVNDFQAAFLNELSKAVSEYRGISEEYNEIYHKAENNFSEWQRRELEKKGIA